MILRRPVRLALVAALPLLTAACGAEPPEKSRAVEAAHPGAGAASQLRQSIEAATFVPPAPEPEGEAGAPTGQSGGAAPSAGGQAGAAGRALPDDARPEPAIVRAQILLDRTRFSPGIIDGLGGENTRQAIAAFEKANDLPVDGELDATVFERLTSGDGGPVLTDYMVTEDDVNGPFIGTVPEDPRAMARLETVAYADAREALAEKFHMSPALLAALNPGVDFGRAGQTIVVAASGPTTLQGKVARIVVDKQERSVRAFAADGRLLAFYPATIGSSQTPSPSGAHTVRAVAPRPNYTYDPAIYGESGGKVIVPPGPNNPVGSVWIDLSRDGYGIHGTPEPAKIGKTASSGCVRLTNWDAEQLAGAVEPGVEVRFV